MNDADTRALVSLLQTLKADGLLSPKMPLPVWKAINGVVPMPVVEVIVTSTEKDFLLTYRKDEYWDGWHIPGGFFFYRESVADACRRVALREIGIEVRFERMIDAYMWPDHPYGSPLSLVCVCHAKELPKEGTFFTEIPEDIIVHHGDFLRTFLQL